MRGSIRLRLAIAMSALGVTQAAGADDAPFYTATYVEIVPPSTAQGVAWLRQHGEASRKDAGNLRVEILQRIDRPNQFTILAVWKDQKAFDAHRASASTNEFRDRLAPMSGALYDERLYTALK